MDITKSLRIPILINTCERLLLSALKHGKAVLLTYSVQISEQFLASQKSNFSVFESNLIEKQTCRSRNYIFFNSM